MKASELVSTALKVSDMKTLYVMGAFGAPGNDLNKKRYQTNHVYNTKAVRKKMIEAATADMFFFDCCGLIKGILWGFTGNKSLTYGGATYVANNVPDISADQMIKSCKVQNTDFKDIVPGAILWTTGHVGIYVGNGMAVECTPAFKNCVQITYVKNVGPTPVGQNGRTWKKWGLFTPYVEYDETVQAEVKTETKTETTVKKSIDEVARLVIQGKYGNGANRRMKLTAEGYDYSEVQARVNQLLKGGK